MMNNLPPYAGIGSQKTPEVVQNWMEAISLELEKRGFLLRSGNAKGADKAFARKVSLSRKRIYLPVKRFQGADNINFSLPSKWENWREALEIASLLHPAWNKLDSFALDCMGRNVYQVLGDDLNSPVKFVMCWAPSPRIEEGRVVDTAGGTGMAVRLAAKRGIAVYHLGLSDHRQKIGGVLGVELPEHCAEADTTAVKIRKARVA
jgi:hypothetical protein